VLGVPYSAIVLNAVLMTALFLIAKLPLVLLAGLAVHLASAAITANEPRAFDLWRAKLTLTPRLPNAQAWGMNSYRV
jgi:type IV secretory pathway VirB3-like protein